MFERQKMLSLIGLLVLVAAVAAGAFYLMKVRPGGPSAENLSPSSTPSSESGEMVACPMDARVCPDGSSVGRSGPNCEFAACPGEESKPSSTTGLQTYQDKQGIFSVSYPAAYTQDESVNSANNTQIVRLHKTGPTQRGQTEMYDGVIVVFEVVDLQGQTLEKWLDDRLAQATADGTLEIVKPKTAKSLNGQPGFVYTARGLGTFDTQVVQKDATGKYALQITTLVADPANQGFQAEVDSILSSLRVLK